MISWAALKLCEKNMVNRGLHKYLRPLFERMFVHSALSDEGEEEGQRRGVKLMKDQGN
jgi:hypothetical protein